jgi:glycosyltransferase involved in cell wall biosynthesis
LVEAIRSVLAQTYDRLEILVSDNCSTDGTENVVAQFQDPRIKYSRNPVNIGSGRNVDNLLRSASGKYVKLLLDDDLIEPFMIERVVSVFESNPSVGVVHGNVRYIDSLGKDKGLFTGDQKPRPGYVKGSVFFVDQMMSENLVFLQTAVIRNSILKKAGYTSPRGRFPGTYYTGDYYLWMKMSLYTDFFYLPECISVYRFHSGQDTNIMNKNLHMYINMARWHALRHPRVRMLISAEKYGSLKKWVIQESIRTVYIRWMHSRSLMPAWYLGRECLTTFPFLTFKISGYFIAKRILRLLVK